MYGCPNCGQNLKFDIKRQMMHCDYCDTVMDPYAITEKTEAVMHKENVEGDNDTGAHMQVIVYTCPQCGGEIVSDDNEAMVFCSFCGASTPLNARMSDMRRPELIIPFSKTKEDCANAYQKLTRRALFAPKEVKDPSHISGFRAIYMPYWIYDFERSGDTKYSAKHSYQKGDYEYTDHYSVSTNVKIKYDGVNFDASSSFSDNLSQAIAPYDIRQAKPFTTAFMSGFYADLMDVPAETYEFLAKTAVSEDAADKLQSNQRSAQYSIDHKSVVKAVWPDTVKQTLAMLPVWFMSYKTRDKKGNERVLYSVVNGQTGEAVADLPISIKKYIVSSLVVAVPLFILLNIFLTLRPTTLLWAAVVISVLCLIGLYYEVRKITYQEYNADDLGVMSLTRQSSLKQEKRKILRTVANPDGTFREETVDMGKLVSEEWKKEWRKNRLYFFISLICAAVCLFLLPVQDIYYYFGVVITGICNCLMMVNIMLRYNMLTSRPLPQFKKKGGDDSAKF